MSPWGSPRSPKRTDSRVAPPRPRAHGPNHKSPQVVGHPVCLA